MNRSSRQKINKDTLALNDILDQMDLIDICRILHSKPAKYTFFSSAHGTFSRIDHMLGHKRSLSKFTKIDIKSSIFSDHSSVKLEINSKKKTGKNTNKWRLKTYYKKAIGSTKKLKKKSKNTLR